MADERLYVIPLRSSWINTTRVKRANRSIHTIQEFLSKHMHVETVKISEGINQAVWARGAEKPPGKIKVKAKKEGDIVIATLPDEKLPEKPKEKPAKAMDKAKEIVGAKKIGEIEKEAKEDHKKETKEKPATSKKESPAKENLPKAEPKEAKK
ncbi:MAG: 50S ribosomal protein L31e [Candidatus Aenigmatarchaeota archaeon]